MSRIGLLVTIACVAAPLLATAAHAYDPDAQVQNAQGYDTTLQQQAAGASTTPAGGDVLPDGIAVTAAFGTDYASGDALAFAVGAVTMSMDKCPANTMGDDQRVVRVQLAKPDFETATVVNTLLLNAAKYAWANCPQAFVNMGTGAGTGQFHHDVSEIDIYLPDGTKGFSGSLGMYGQGDMAYAPGREYKWERLVDQATIQRRQAAAQAQAAQAAAEQQAQIAAQGPPRTFDDDVNGFFGAIGKAIEFVIGLTLAIWIFAKREAILRWFYGLQPHPATTMVDRAVYAGAEIDGDLYERVLHPVPGGRIEKEVRSRQARDLTARLREHEAALRSDERQRVEAERKRVEQENAVARAHAELLKAGVDHEIAAARLDELKKATRRR